MRILSCNQNSCTVIRPGRKTSLNDEIDENSILTSLLIPEKRILLVPVSPPGLESRLLAGKLSRPSNPRPPWPGLVSRHRHQTPVRAVAFLPFVPNRPARKGFPAWAWRALPRWRRRRGKDRLRSDRCCAERPPPPHRLRL